MKQDEFKSRYIIKLISSVLIALLNIIIQMLLPRVFTVEEYGYYTYNLNVFTSVVGIATLSAPNALVSKLSKRNEEIGLILFYLKFYLLMALVLNFAVIALYASGFLQDTFIGQTLLIVFLGLESSIVLRLHTDSIGIFDAMAVSRYPAVMQIALKVVMSMAVIVSLFLGKLNLACFYIIQAFLTFIFTFSMLYEIIKDQKQKYPVKVDYGSKRYIREFWIFCRPLVLSNIISQVIVILMNWALMNWAGAVEQAMFGAAWQLNTLVSYIFSPYAELSKREFAVICDDIEAIRHRYIQSLKLMVWITSYFAIFIGFTSEWLLPIIYGDKYAGAMLVTILIMFYTIYQAWGQISGAFQLATERTKENAVIGVIGQFIMLGMVFVFQIPNFIWPAGLGSTGIALTYLVSNIMSVTISLYINSKIINVAFGKSFLIQFAPLFLCSSCIIVLKYVIDILWIGNSMMTFIGKTLIVGIIYTGIIGIVVWINPQFLGITKENLKQVIKIKK